MKQLIILLLAVLSLGCSVQKPNHQLLLQSDSTMIGSTTNGKIHWGKIQSFPDSLGTDSIVAIGNPIGDKFCDDAFEISPADGTIRTPSISIPFNAEDRREYEYIFLAFILGVAIGLFIGIARRIIKL